MRHPSPRAALVLLVLATGCGGAGAGDDTPRSIAPAFTAEPEDALRGEGATATFAAAVTGDPAPSLQWERRGPADAGWSVVPGANGPALTTPALALADHGARYRVRAVNVAGTATSREALLEVVALPAVQSFAAAAGKLTAGETTTLSWAFTGGEGVLEGIGPVPATGSLDVTPAASATWTLTVTSPAGEATSGEASVSVYPAPVVASFEAAEGHAPPGEATTLLAVFDAGPEGTAIVEPGVGPVASGVAASTGPLAQATAFTLTVTNGAGRAETRQVTVTLGIDVHPGESIQAALDRAVAGTTVLVHPGTYSPLANAEAFLVLRATRNGVTLRGAGTSPAQVVLDGQQRVLHVVFVDEGVDASTRIENLTVTGGRAHPYELFPGYPAGFTPGLRPDVPPDDDFYHDGAGLMLFRAAPALRDLEVRGNYAFRCGGGISVFAQGKTGFPAEGPLLQDLHVHHNQAGSGTGGGVDVYNAANAEIANVLFVANDGWGAHVAILDGARALIRSSTFAGGWSGEGGVVATPGATAIVRDSIFADMPGTTPLVLRGPEASAARCAFWNVPAGFVPPGTGHVLADPLFVEGPRGTHYLSQEAAGQAATSPCVNAGGGPAEEALPGRTTRTDGVPDSDLLDLGYHHRP